jgi:electron transfer flavoprotein alpha subunit
MNEIMIIAEQRMGKIAKVSFELLGIAKELSKKLSCSVSATLIGHNIINQAGLLVEYGADRVYCFDSDIFEYYNTDCYFQAAEKVIKREQPQIVLFGASSIGRDLAPRLSARLSTGLTADCTKLEIGEDGKLWMTRPAFGGNLFATILCPDHFPQMSTVRPGVMVALPREEGREGEIISESSQDIVPKFAMKVVRQEREEKNEQNIEEAKILFSIGRGGAKSETISSAKRAAAVAKGAVSSSRAVVDSGIMPQSVQVGQTGKTVRPIIYLALGISGAVQHLAGMDQSDYIIAVNSDQNAPIFSLAHLSIVGDANKIMPILEQKIKEYNAKA